MMTPECRARREDEQFNLLSSELQQIMAVDPKSCLRIRSLSMELMNEDGRTPMDILFSSLANDGCWVSPAEGFWRDHDFWHHRAVRCTPPLGGHLIRLAARTGYDLQLQGDTARAANLMFQIDNCLLLGLSGTGRFNTLADSIGLTRQSYVDFDLAIDEYADKIQQLRYK